jgi:hypothetical protein
MATSERWGIEFYRRGWFFWFGFRHERREVELQRAA